MTATEAPAPALPPRRVNQTDLERRQEVRLERLEALDPKESDDG